MGKDQRPFLIGVTGSLASGKTVVSDMFAAKGAVKIDADSISHELLDNGKIKNAVIAVFGEDILSGSIIDRRKLAAKVFGDRVCLDKLCSIMHPVIRDEIKERVKRSKAEVIVIDAPLLVESGFYEYVDVIVVVMSNRNIQINRAISRGISKEEACAVIDSQMPFGEKIKFADYVIDNNGSLKITKEGVEKIWQRMLEK